MTDPRATRSDDRRHPDPLAWRCEEHRWNTCPLTESALRYSVDPCCERAQPLAAEAGRLPAQRTPTAAAPQRVGR